MSCQNVLNSTDQNEDMAISAIFVVPYVGCVPVSVSTTDISISGINVRFATRQAHMETKMSSYSCFRAARQKDCREIQLKRAIKSDHCFPSEGTMASTQTPAKNPNTGDDACWLMKLISNRPSRALNRSTCLRFQSLFENGRYTVTQSDIAARAVSKMKHVLWKSECLDLASEQTQALYYSLTIRIYKALLKSV